MTEKAEAHEPTKVVGKGKYEEVGVNVWDVLTASIS